MRLIFGLMVLIGGICSAGTQAAADSGKIGAHYVWRPEYSYIPLGIVYSVAGIVGVTALLLYYLHKKP